MKLRNLEFFAKEDEASGLTEFTLFICTSAFWGQILFPVHLASGIPPAPQWWAASIRCIAAWGALIHIWRPGIADGCDISC